MRFDREADKDDIDFRIHGRPETVVVLVSVNVAYFELNITPINVCIIGIVVKYGGFPCLLRRLKEVHEIGNKYKHTSGN